MKQNRSLRLQITTSFLLTVVILIGSIVLVTNRVIVNLFNDMVYASGQYYARRMAVVFTQYYDVFGSWDGVDNFVKSFSDPGPSASISKFTGVRNSFFDNLLNGDERLILLDSSGNMIADSYTEGGNLPNLKYNLDKGVSIYRNNEIIGTVIVASSLGTMNEIQNFFLQQLNFSMLIMAIIAIFIVVLVGSIQSKRIIRPIQTLAKATTEIAKGNFSDRIPVTRKDEIGELTVSFNSMIEKLNYQRELRQRSTADIAHELRTPLSILQIDIESLEDGILEMTPENINELKNEVNHLSHLVEDLRILSLADANELTMEFQSLDVIKLIRQIEARVKKSANEKNIHFEVQVPEKEIFVNGDEQRLSQVLLNLIQNAIQYTRTNGNIFVSTNETDKNIVIAVQDDGIGIAPDELKNIFERLYRASKSRDRNSGGSGLGLAIAKSLVEAHHGEIWVESVEGQGSTFFFSLPVLQNNSAQLTIQAHPE